MAVQAGMPTGIFQARHMPCALTKAIQDKYFTKKIPHLPKIFFGLIRPIVYRFRN
jgi:hypothetical protein